MWSEPEAHALACVCVCVVHACVCVCVCACVCACVHVVWVCGVWVHACVCMRVREGGGGARVQRHTPLSLDNPSFSEMFSFSRAASGGQSKFHLIPSLISIG